MFCAFKIIAADSNMLINFAIHSNNSVACYVDSRKMDKTQIPLLYQKSEEYTTGVFLHTIHNTALIKKNDGEVPSASAN